MGILLGDASDVICDGTAADHDGAVNQPLAYWGRFPPTYTTEGPHFLSEGLSEAAEGSPQKPHNTPVRRLRRNLW